LPTERGWGHPLSHRGRARDEHNGLEIVRRCFEITRAPQRRRCRRAIVNLDGFRRGTRPPDRRDLNRYFPGKGSAAAQLPTRCSRRRQTCDYLVDITGSFHRTNHAGARRSDLDVVELSRRFGSTVMHTAVPSVLRRAATDAGIPR
jgi:hypothetical protein